MGALNIKPEIAAEILAAQTAGDWVREGLAIRAMVQDEIGGKFRSNQFAPPVIDRFFQKVRFGFSDCWYWCGSLGAGGYGGMAALGENKAHRVSYRLFKGPIPEGMDICHTCDNRQCVNPDHLWPGTALDNIRDMWAKGRGRVVPRYGEANPMSKLSAQQVEEIRAFVAAGNKQIAAARKWGVSPMTISRLIRRETWNA